jgi:uncharacterized membrane protein SirB2
MSITFDPNRGARASFLAGSVVGIRLWLVRLVPFATLILIEPWLATATMLAGIWRRLDRTLAKNLDGGGAVGLATQRHTHVLAAASNLLGICLIIIGGLKLTNQSSRTYSDEVAWIAAFCMLASIFLSYTRLRDGRDRAWRTRLVDYFFLVGVGALIVSMLFAAYQL